MAGWQDELVATLTGGEGGASTQGPTTDSRATASARAHEVFELLRTAFGSAIASVAGRLNTTVEGRHDEGAHRGRWTFAARSITLRLDADAARVFLSADVGHDLALEELDVAQDGAVTDARGRPVATDELVQRFVTLLFRG